MRSGIAPLTERTFLGERLWPGVTLALAIAEAEGLARAADGLRRKGRPVRYIRASLVPEDETLFLWFGAPSAPSVAEIGERAGSRFDRISLIIDLPIPTATRGRNGTYP
jgi:hypothetical protein